MSALNASDRRQYRGGFFFATRQRSIDAFGFVDRLRRQQTKRHAIDLIWLQKKTKQNKTIKTARQNKQTNKKGRLWTRRAAAARGASRGRD